MFLLSFQICFNTVQFESFQSYFISKPYKNRLDVLERGQIAERYEVWGFVVKVQRWWRTIKGNYILKTNYSCF